MSGTALNSARTRREKNSNPGTSPGIGKMLMLLAGLVILVLALPPFFSFPWLDFWLVPVTAIYLFLLLLLPRLWLIVLPLATVGLDITPWTGRFTYNELDLMFLVTLASGLLYGRYRYRVFAPAPPTIVLLVYLAVIAVGYEGWIYFVLPPQAAYDNPYYTSEYAYKVFKGMIWGLALVPMWGYLLAVDKKRAVNSLIAGLSLAAILLGLIVLWERGTLGVLLDWSAWYHVVSSPPDLTSSYRVTGVFSDMHTGGEVIDGVLLLLLPGTLYGAVYGGRTWLRVLAAAGFLALAYVALVGFTRATYAAFGLGIAIYAGLTLWSRRQWGLALPVPLALPVIIALALGGYQIGARFSHVSEDSEGRQSHWQNVLDSADDSFFRQLLGNGTGSFPGRYIEAHPQRVQRVGSYTVASEGRKEVLRLGGGHDLVIGQRATIEPFHNYTVDVHLRAEQPGRLTVALCERNLLYASNFMPHCVREGMQFEATDGSFRQHTIEINSGRVGERRPVRRWPTVMTIQYEQADGLLEIDTIELSAGSLSPLRNRSFKGGLDYWFYYNDFSHLPWHVKNTFLQVWFEHGWLGLGLLLALLGFLLRANLGRHAHDSLFPVYTTAVITLCVFGLFGSPLDSARVSWLFYFFLGAGLGKMRMRKRSRPAKSVAWSDQKVP